MGDTGATGETGDTGATGQTGVTGAWTLPTSHMNQVVVLCLGDVIDTSDE